MERRLIADAFGALVNRGRAMWKIPVVNVGARLLVLVIVLWWIAKRIQLGEAVVLLQTLDRAAVLGMVASSILFGVLGGIKVWTLLRALARVGLGRTVIYFFVASSIGAFTPASLGDFSLAAFLKREGVPIQEGLAIVLVDRIVSVSLYILVFVPLTLLFLAPHPLIVWLPVLYLLGVGVGFGLNASERARAFVRRNLVERFVPGALEFFRTVSNLLRTKPVALAENVAVGLARCVVGGIVVAFAFAAVGTTTAWLPIIAATNALAVINLVPLSFGGLGVYEGGGVLLFEALGANAPHALAALVLQRIYVVVSSALILAGAAGVYLWRRYQARATRETQTI